MSTNAHTAVLTTERDVPMFLFPGAIGFFFAGRLCITYLFFQSEPQTGAIASFALHLFLLVAVVFYSFGPPSNTLSSMLRVPPVRWVLGFLVFGCFSLLWSATVSVVIAFAYWSEMAAQVAIIFLLLRTGPVEKISSAILKGYIWGACFIAVLEWFSPTMYDLRPGNEDYFTPNAIGFICAFGIFMAQYIGRSAKIWRIVAVFLAISLLRTLSKTTIIAFAIGEMFLLFRDRSMSRKSKLAIALVALLVLWAFWGLIDNYYEVYTHLGNQSETLSGRIGIWAYVFETSVQQPWIGHGFHSFRNVIPPFGDFVAWHAHNELLQQFYAYGVVGIILLIGVYGSFYRQARRLSSPSARAVFLGLLLFIIVRGFADTENFDLSFPLWAIALMSITMAQSENPVPDGRPGLSRGHLQRFQQRAKQSIALKAYPS